MKLFQNKFFLWVLLISFVIYGLSAPVAQAGGGFGTFLIIAAAIVLIAVTWQYEFAPVIATYVSTFTTLGGAAAAGVGGGLTVVTVTTYTYITTTAIIMGELVVTGVTAGLVACAEGITCPGGQTSGMVLAPVAGQDICAFQLPLTFYNPQMSQTSEYFLGPYDYTYWDESSWSYQTQHYDSWCQTRPVDETTKQVAIYRFTLPLDASQETLNDWFFNQIKNQVGNGYSDYTNGDYHTSLVDNNLLVTTPYSKLCSGNICQFTDATVPQNVYVAYVAKILADYVPTSPPPIPEQPTGFLIENALAQTVCPAPYSNKFFNKDDAVNATFPDPSVGLGNAILGPYKSGSAADCPTPNPPSPANPASPANPEAPVSVMDTLTATKSGVGSGTITSNPSGINCGSACSAAFNTDTSVVLTAAPEAGSIFTGWSGDCSGTNNCTVTMDAAKNINANFSVALPGGFSLTLGGSAVCNSVPLSWTASNNAAAYRILRGSPRVDISPYQPYTALNFTDTTVNQNTSYTYQIEAYNPAGTSRSNSVSVTTPYCPPIVSFSASPSSIYQGQSTILNWSTSYATFCSASGIWSGSKSTSGSETVIPSPPPSATYTLTCSGPGGSASQSMVVNIAPLTQPNWQEIPPR